ncbi:MAG TPA: GNAT family N-acetyltransferase [Longimicrobium sp.]|nr:GNAT family N-acetyltransferase [Longimicrobium sp.]
MTPIPSPLPRVPDGPQPTLHSERLILRPFVPGDAAEVHRIVSDREIAANTAHIPHPYPDGMALEWIERVTARWVTGESAVFAATERGAGRIVCAVGLEIEPPHRRGELGYWVARQFWNCGYASECARAVVAFGFRELGLNRVAAHHYARNPASGRVMQKIGMTWEGKMRKHILKWGVFEDIEIYGILADELPH